MTNSKHITSLSGYNRRLWLIAVALGLLLTVVAPELQADDKKQDAPKADDGASNHTPRKLLHKIEPVYPQDLKRRSIGGVVKLDLKISASGNVEKVEIVGGNPILADSAAQAVKKWQYAPAGASSSMVLNVEFNPNH
ncbi:MAG TPA: energy transducer TonB [Terriglobales bacterium]